MRRLKIDLHCIRQPETEIADVEKIRQALATDTAITHIALVHCETTTGLLNPIEEVGKLASEYGKVYIVDAMSSFGGYPMTLEGTARRLPDLVGQ